MKKEILTLFLLFLAASCSIQQDVVQKSETNFEFRELPTYPDFFLSHSLEVNFEFMNLGKIFSRLIFDYNPQKKGNNISDHYSGNPEKVIDQLHQNALNIGANGIIDLQIEYIPTIPPSYFSSGIAIKRK